jgi:RNA polymerase sigma-70 factor (ECF subfamily)
MIGHRKEQAKQEAFAAWALPYMDQVHSACLYLTRQKEEAEDLQQETYLRAYRFWHQFTPGTNCKAWLMTILHNTFKNRYRERHRDMRTIEFDESTCELDSDLHDTLARTNPEEIVFSRLLDGPVEAALKALPVEFLEVILLVDIQELTYEEAGAVVGSPVGTIRSRLSRGRRLLQASLTGYAQQRGHPVDTRSAVESGRAEHISPKAACGRLR